MPGKALTKVLLVVDFRQLLFFLYCSVLFEFSAYAFVILHFLKQYGCTCLKERKRKKESGEEK